MAIRVTRELMRRGWRRKGLRFRLGMLGGLWAGLVLSVYTFCGGRHIFMERPLSLNHSGLEKKCGDCHHPFSGVTDTNCATNCHVPNYDWSLPVEFRVKKAGIPYQKGVHYKAGQFDRQNDCLSCHPAECHTRDLKQQPPVPPECGDNCDTEIIDNLKKATDDVDYIMGVAECKPNNKDNLVLPQPLTEALCKNCHKGCERSTRCFDCHSEHRDGLPLTINRPQDVFPGKEPVPVEYITPRGSLENYDWTQETVNSFERIRPRMSGKSCIGCHPDVLTRKRPTPEEVEKSPVSFTMFSHISVGHIFFYDQYNQKRYWRCKDCHANHKDCGFRCFPFDRDPQENIFTMEACAEKCHYRDDCTTCHRFHDPVRQPGEHVDWPYQLREARESGTATGEASLATPEESISTPEDQLDNEGPDPTDTP